MKTSRRGRQGLYLALLFVLFVTSISITAAADATSEPGWHNETELSLVVTEGNSNTDTLGVKNTLTRRWERGRLVFRVDGVRSNTDDDRFLLVAPGATVEPGGELDVSETLLVDPDKEPDVEKYFAGLSYDERVGATLTWNVGASWDRNEDAGILNRTILFGGLGNRWRSDETLTFETGYGLSYTDREEEFRDPEKDEQFAGLRLTTDIEWALSQTTTLDFALASNLNLEDTSDYFFDTRLSINVSINRWLSLGTGVQLLYNSEPALEEVDIIARVEIIDPDGIPGSGDEFFRTVSSGGAGFEVGTGRVRLEELDTIFRTSLVVNF